jgi:hypothetical protein
MSWQYPDTVMSVFQQKEHSKKNNRKDVQKAMRVSTVINKLLLSG